MIDAISDALVLSLVEDVAKLLGLPATCFYLTVGSKVLRDYMSLAAEGVGSDSVIRVCEECEGECNRPLAVLVAADLAVAATLGNGPAQTRSAQRNRRASGVEP